MTCFIHVNCRAHLDIKRLGFKIGKTNKQKTNLMFPTITAPPAKHMIMRAVLSPCNT